VLTLKFRSGRHLVPLMGSFLRDALRNRPVQVDLVVPVPLSPRRHRERGFNQAALLAEQVVDAVGGVLAADALRRRDRPAQSALSGAARRSNLAGAFQCASASDIHGRRVLLVDDVVTTGATLSACADTLALAGAGRICAIAFARDL
jgi:ComF family protein